MVEDDFWRTVRDKDRMMRHGRRMGALNLALLFGTAVIALTLILTPMIADDKDTSVLASAPLDHDTMTTGSIPDSGEAKRYTVRRSVLQPTPGAVCIVDANGSQSGC
ncbi:hypothetical protein [Rhizobium sp. SG2393]|uniref:hypothetical protein n=1 Tax=Rhizobium sp. SG2393 TaxID=3276279 RepID=UPI00366B5105